MIKYFYHMLLLAFESAYMSGIHNVFVQNTFIRLLKHFVEYFTIFTHEYSLYEILFEKCQRSKMFVKSNSGKGMKFLSESVY